MTLPSAARDKTRTWLTLAACAFAYLYVAPLFPAINNPNENVRFYMTAAIVDDGTYEISGPRRRWGWTNDAAEIAGRFYSVKAPGTSFLAVPTYAAYRQFTRLSGTSWDKTTALYLCRLTTVTLPCFLFLVFFYRFMQRATPYKWANDAVFFSVALGSLFYGYGLLLVSHSTSGAAGFLAFALMFQGRRRVWQGMSRKTAAAAGLATAGVTFFEYPGLIISLCLTSYALIAIRPFPRLIWFIAGALLPTLAMMHFQNAAFGSPWTPGHLHVENPAFRAVHEQGFFGATGFHTEAATGLLFDPAFGLFPLTPIFVFAPLGFLALLGQRHTRVDAAVVLAACVTTVFAIATMDHWRGGWTLGPRYLCGLVPFLAWPAVVGLATIAAKWSTIARTLSLTAVLSALVASGIPSAYYPHIPEPFEKPLGELFWPLIAHGFAPLNGGHMLGLVGSWSMAPWGLAMLLAAVVLCVSHGTTARMPSTFRTVFVLASALVLTAGWLHGLARPNAEEPRQSLALVTNHWHPKGGDVASRLALRLKAAPDRSGFRRLGDIYEKEARHDLAARARNRARRIR